ncbi:dystrophin-like [Rhineura floridana]|uniref:dystrophin-like n=1 Tax=Rhineura floridana TaxID=261503 RepID=UPI002AC7EFAF|nr:dystrophin-like [Rhineura floridana]
MPFLDITLNQWVCNLRCIRTWLCRENKVSLLITEMEVSHHMGLPQLILDQAVFKAEYDRLKQQHDHKGLSPLPSSPDMMPISPQSSQDAELIAEAKLFHQRKGCLEARMQILEDHNKQLESQLHRLRQLLEQPQVDAKRMAQLSLLPPQRSDSNHPMLLCVVGNQTSESMCEDDLLSPPQDTKTELEEVMEQLNNSFPSTR